MTNETMMDDPSSFYTMIGKYIGGKFKDFFSLCMFCSERFCTRVPFCRKRKEGGRLFTFLLQKLRVVVSKFLMLKVKPHSVLLSRIRVLGTLVTSARGSAVTVERSTLLDDRRHLEWKSSLPIGPPRRFGFGHCFTRSRDAKHINGDFRDSIRQPYIIGTV